MTQRGAGPRVISGISPQTGNSSVQVPGADQARVLLARQLDAVREEVLAEAQQAREELLIAARGEIAQLLATAHEEADLIREAGHADKQKHYEAGYQAGEAAGFKKGYADGQAKLAEETTGLLQGAHELMDRAFFAEKRMHTQARETLARLVQEICQRVLGQTLAAEPSGWLSLVDTAIQQMAEGSQVKLVISQSLYQWFCAQPQAEAWLKQRRVLLLPDAQLDRDQAYLIAREGQWNLSLEAQISGLLQPLKPLLPLAPQPAAPPVPDHGPIPPN
jgi:flagellar biosynthesis/type III secretory pathway protein FliH